MSTRTHYIAAGSVRGPCAHQHRTVEAAQACVERDRRDCRSLGGGAYSDRAVRAVDVEGSGPARTVHLSRELTDRESAPLDQAAWDADPIR